MKLTAYVHTGLIDQYVRIVVSFFIYLCLSLFLRNQGIYLIEP